MLQRRLHFESLLLLLLGCLVFSPIAAQSEIESSIFDTSAAVGPLDSSFLPMPTPTPTPVLDNQPQPDSILDELQKWQVPDLTQLSDPTIAAPKQFVASCNMLCSIGWEEDITAPTFTKHKVLRCSTVNLVPIQFDAETECNAETGFCQRVLLD